MEGWDNFLKMLSWKTKKDMKEYIIVSKNEL